MRARRAARVGGRHTALRSAPRRARLRPLRHLDRALRALPPWPSGRGSWVACVPAARLPPLSRRDLRDVRVGTPYLCGPGGSGVYRHRGGGAGGVVWGVRRPRLSVRSLAAPAITLVCMLLVVAPWTIRNALVLHRFVPVTTELGNTMAGTYNDETRLSPDRPAAWTEPRMTREYSHYYRERGLNDATLDQKLRSAAFHYIGKHPTYLW